MQFAILRELIHLTDNNYVFCFKHSSMWFTIAHRNILKKKERQQRKKKVKKVKRSNEKLRKGS